VAPELREADLVAVREQLGREPTVAFEVVARCTGGHPLVIRNAPLDADGRPFPTLYWLTCPAHVKAVSRLEAEGWIGRLNERSETDPGFGRSLEAAHAAYAEDRASRFGAARGWGGVGGARRGVKCLHAHLAHRYAGGDDPVGRIVDERIGDRPLHPENIEQQRSRVAVIDQGTNSSRLLIVEPPPEVGGQPREIARDMIITRLGKGVDETGELDEGAIRRTLTVIERYARRARAMRARSIKIGMTSAVRDASNRDRFLSEVRRLAHASAGASSPLAPTPHVELEVLSGDDEARLTFLGGTHGLDPSEGPYFVLDIGGGSTEFVVGAPGKADTSISTQMGSVRLTERLIRHDPPTSDDLDAVAAAVDERIDQAVDAVPAASSRTFVSVAGTATTIQAIALGLARYDPDRIHRTWLARDDVDRVLLELAAMTNVERAAIPVMAPGRGDVIVAGASILARVMRRLGFDRTLVSETDILDGLAFRAMEVG
jgi:exopolyphosphatase / guanosine-5'-triphosphate,3'-diphosphate pyrophosphatase